MRVLSSCHSLSLLLILFLPSSVVAQSLPHGDNVTPLSTAEYGKLLDRIEADLRGWEPFIRNIDPGKGDTSYKTGTDIADNKRFGLISIQNARNFIGQQRTKRTVYGEIALAGFLGSVNGEIFQLSLLGAFNDLSVEQVGEFGREGGKDEMGLKNDGMRRLRILEDIPCAH